MKLQSYVLLAQWLAISCAFAQEGTEKLPAFGDVVNMLGNMERTDQDFQDGLALDLFSPKNRTVTVKQNTKPLSGTFVSGSTGEPFVALSNYSYIITVNETANDLIAKIEVPYNLTTLNNAGVQECNTYVGKLAPDGLSWVIDETKRNVHRSENNTRIIKMVSITGEFLLLGRQTVDVTNIFVQYGQGATRTFNITGGAGRQEAEFVDGLRFSVIAEKPMGLNVDLKNGIDPAALPKGAMSLNSFAWVVNTSDSNQAVNASIRFPVNRLMLEALRMSEPNTLLDKIRGNSTFRAKLSVAWKPLNASLSATFQSIDVQTKNTTNKVRRDSILVKNVPQLDGQYVILVDPRD